MSTPVAKSCTPEAKAAPKPPAAEQATPGICDEAQMSKVFVPVLVNMVPIQPGDELLVLQTRVTRDKRPRETEAIGVVKLAKGC